MKIKIFTELFKWSVLSAIIAAAMPELACAAEDVNSLITTVTKEQLPALPYALSAVCYVGGSFMLVSGALSLKKHAENPTAEPMAKGIARLITGGAITGVPALTGIIQKTTTMDSGNAATFTALKPTFGQ